MRLAAVVRPTLSLRFGGLALWLALSGLCMACGSTATAAKTPHDVASRVARAAAAGQGDLLMALVPTLDEIQDRCPKLVARVGRLELVSQLADMRMQMAERVDRCAEAADWSGAKVLWAGGGERRRDPDQDCTYYVEARPIFAVISVGESGALSVVLDEPGIAGGERYVLIKGPKCIVVDRGAADLCSSLVQYASEMPVDACIEFVVQRGGADNAELVSCLQAARSREAIEACMRSVESGLR